MNDIDKRLMQQSAQIFQRFTNAVNKISPGYAAVGVLAAMAPFTGVAVWNEVSNFNQLMEQGKPAIDAYVAANPHGAFKTIVEAVKGNLDSPTLTSLGRHAAAMAILPPVTAVATVFAKQFVNMKARIEELQQENSNLSRGLVPDTPPTARPAEPKAIRAPDAPSGASPVDREELVALQAQRRGGLVEQLERGIQALEQGQSLPDTGHKSRLPGM